VSRELKRAYPDRRKLECQCICAVAFVKNEVDLLDSPCWIMLINIVAMDMLKSKIPPGENIFRTIARPVRLAECLMVNRVALRYCVVLVYFSSKLIICL